MSVWACDFAPSRNDHSWLHTTYVKGEEFNARLRDRDVREDRETECNRGTHDSLADGGMRAFPLNWRVISLMDVGSDR